MISWSGDKEMEGSDYSKGSVSFGEIRVATIGCLP